jgi:hypothetical protein
MWWPVCTQGDNWGCKALMYSFSNSSGIKPITFQKIPIKAFWAFNNMQPYHIWLLAPANREKLAAQKDKCLTQGHKMMAGYWWKKVQSHRFSELPGYVQRQ